MNYVCKVVYRDRLEPTTYLNNVPIANLKEIIEHLLEELAKDENVRAIYVGKLESEY
jgi:hypothetical protein